MRTLSLLICAVLTLAPFRAAAQDQGITIHQAVDLAASPARVYEMLLSSKEFAAFSGRPATIDPKVGGEFSLFSAHIIGVNVELVPNTRIVQAWRVVDWPAGVYSIARFELTPKGTGTHLVFDHTGFPPGLKEHLAEGWEMNYWSLMKKYLK
jgi:activator of HSP90 ATPase